MDYDAVQFLDALGDYIAKVNNPGPTASVIRERARNTLIPFSYVPVFHHIKFVEHGITQTIDAVQVQLEQRDSHRRIIPWFDTFVIQSSGPKGTVIQTH